MATGLYTIRLICSNNRCSFNTKRAPNGEVLDTVCPKCGGNLVRGTNKSIRAEERRVKARNEIQELENLDGNGIR